MANEKKRYQQTTYGNVAYDLNYQRNVVPVPDGGEPSDSPSPESIPEPEPVSAAA